MSRVLLAEDEPALLESYYELVLGLGHECVTARDGNEALELARKQTPDLVVTDFMMPGRTGVELMRALKADPVLAGVPTILLTAGRPSEAERAEAWYFLPKPVNVERFEQAVEEGLRAAGSRNPPERTSAHSDRDVSPVTLAREQMLSWVAHEIKSPVSAAITAAELALRSLRMGDDAAGVERRLNVITRQLIRMDELVNSVLDAAQLQDGRLRLELETITLAPFIERVVAYWKDVQPEFQFELLDGDDLVVEADLERLRQILDNLISNAIKYGQPGKLIEIRVDANDQHVNIAVRDEGAGISASELPHIFDRFHRVAGQGGRGHGLGLYIAAALARLHGGQLSVQSEIGRGSTFTLLLPRRAGV